MKLLDENYNKKCCQMILKRYYGSGKLKTRRWVTYLKDQILFSGYYNSEGQKVDFWREICGNYDQLNNTYIEGAYNDQGKKIGYWNIYNDNFKIEGGNYNQFGIKVSEWKEVDQNYRKNGNLAF